jgi:hypothetical protein
MIKGSSPEDGATENELIRAHCQSEQMADGETVRWEAWCRCGVLLRGESRRPRIPPLTRCGACARLVLLLEP